VPALLTTRVIISWIASSSEPRSKGLKSDGELTSIHFSSRVSLAYLEGADRRPLPNSAAARTFPTDRQWQSSCILGVSLRGLSPAGSLGARFAGRQSHHRCRVLRFARASRRSARRSKSRFREYGSRRMNFVATVSHHNVRAPTARQRTTASGVLHRFDLPALRAIFAPM
jgi:hypothetical protein